MKVTRRGLFSAFLGSIGGIVMRNGSSTTGLDLGPNHTIEIKSADPDRWILDLDAKIKSRLQG